MSEIVTTLKLSHGQRLTISKDIDRAWAKANLRGYRKFVDQIAEVKSSEKEYKKLRESIK